MEARSTAWLVWTVSWLCLASSAAPDRLSDGPEPWHSFRDLIHPSSDAEVLWEDASTPRSGAASPFSTGITTLTYDGPQTYVPASLLPWLAQHSHAISAEVDIPHEAAEGALVVVSGQLGRYVLYVKNRKLQCTHDYRGRILATITSSKAIPIGRSTLRLSYEKRGGENTAAATAVVRLFINGEKVSELPFVEAPNIASGRTALADAAAASSNLSTAAATTALAMHPFTGVVRNVRFDMASGENPADTRYVVD